MLQPILPGGEDGDRFAEILQAMFLAQETANTQGGAEGTLTSESPSLADVFLDEAQRSIGVAQSGVNQRSLRSPWSRSGIDESISGGKPLDSPEISQRALWIA